MSGIVIVGAGQAGASLAAKLRALGHSGPITMIGEEPVPPYQRPPLSKAYLLGEMELERLYLRASSFWEEQAITLRLGTRAEAIDTAARTVRLQGGEVIGYDDLALTTGSRPRRLPAAIGGDLGRVFTVRTLADVDRMAPEFRAGARALIVGGGYIGLEAAAVAAKLGLDVTLIEAAPRILQRVAAPETSDYFRKLHTAHGVKIREGTGLERLTGEGDVRAAILSDGTEMAVDLVIVAPHVWAAGDCASFPHDGGRIRLESVGNAIDQAEIVAANILGAETPYAAKPWFWSDQYDVKLQIAGLNAGYDRIVTRQGDSGAVSFWYYRGDRLLALDAMNDARAYMIGKRLIEAGKSPDPALIADATADLKPLLKA